MTLELHRDFSSFSTLHETSSSVFLLQSQSPFVWVIQIPKQDSVRELYELEDALRMEVLREAVFLQKLMAEEFVAKKMNFACLGNITPQLHLHHIVRYEDDPCWPHPVWGQFVAKPKTKSEMLRLERSFAKIFSQL